MRKCSLKGVHVFVAEKPIEKTVSGPAVWLMKMRGKSQGQFQCLGSLFFTSSKWNLASVERFTSKQ